MRTGIMLIGLILTAGTFAGVYLGVKLKHIRKIEQETQDRAQLASQNIKDDLEGKRQRDEIVLGWLNEHELLQPEVFVGFNHLSENVGGKIISCPKCKEF